MNARFHGRVAGRVAFVTGAGTGIGRAACVRLAQEGATVFASSRTLAHAEETCAEVERAAGVAAHALALDVADRAAVDRAADEIAARAGRIDIVVASAGFTLAHAPSLMDTTDEEWQRIFSVNVTGMFSTCRAALRHMPKGGAIVTVGSINSFVAWENDGAYTASKGAVLQFTRALALDVVARGIRVNTRLPGRDRHAADARVPRSRRRPRRAGGGVRRGRADEPHGHGGGDRQLHPLPRLRRGELRHRHVADRRRRHGDPAVSLVLGADTLCWHQRLEQRDLTLEQCFSEAAEAGARFVQLSLHHAREYDTEQLPALARRAGDLGLELLASGDPLGGAHRGEAPAAAAARVEQWLERAAALGSPILRVASGFYRADLAARPGAIEAEREWTIEALGGALPAARAAGIVLAIENHSDFTVAEYRSILEATGDVRVFLDLINPVVGAGGSRAGGAGARTARGRRPRQGLRAGVDLDRGPATTGAASTSSGATPGRASPTSARCWPRWAAAICTSRSRDSTTGPTGATRSSGCAAASRSCAS